MKLSGLNIPDKIRFAQLLWPQYTEKSVNDAVLFLSVRGKLHEDNLRNRLLGLPRGRAKGVDQIYDLLALRCPHCGARMRNFSRRGWHYAECGTRFHPFHGWGYQDTSCRVRELEIMLRRLHKASAAFTGGHVGSPDEIQELGNAFEIADAVLVK